MFKGSGLWFQVSGLWSLVSGFWFRNPAPGTPEQHIYLKLFKNHYPNEKCTNTVC